MEYEWQRGDSWSELGLRFYGDKKMAALLRQFNEGASYLAPAAWCSCLSMTAAMTVPQQGLAPWLGPPSGSA